MKPKRQERLTDTTKIKTTTTSNVPLRERGTRANPRPTPRPERKNDDR